MKVQRITDIQSKEVERIKTGVLDFDKFLGGGFMPGSTILFAGEPGVGKSTFVLQVADALAKQKQIVLYASGEENLTQIKDRADRLDALDPDIWCSEAINLEELFKLIEKLNPRVIVVDSLQMIYSSKIRQAPSSPTQMKFCLSELIKYIKKTDKVLIAIGHSTKTGLIAGLLTLQHMVDATFFMTLVEGTDTRNLHSNKNRFGQAQVDWQIEMTKDGLDLGELDIPEEKTRVLEIPNKEDSNKESEVTIPAGEVASLFKGDFLGKYGIDASVKVLLRKKFGPLKKVKDFDIICRVEEEK